MTLNDLYEIQPNEWIVGRRSVIEQHRKDHGCEFSACIEYHEDGYGFGVYLVACGGKLKKPEKKAQHESVRIMREQRSLFQYVAQLLNADLNKESV